MDEVDQLRIPDMTPMVSASASALDFCHTTVASFIKLGYAENDIQTAYNKLKTDEKHNIVNDLTVDDIEFKPVLLNILENEMKCETKKQRTSYDDDILRRRRSSNLERAASILETSDTMDNLWRNFICCIPIKFLVDYYSKNGIEYETADHLKKENKNENENKLGFGCMDKLFYLVIYVWVMTDFFCRIFPILACSHLRHSYLEFVEVAVLLGLFEFIMYYYMLSGQFKTPRAASSFFWTLYMTISYCLLSTMHIVHLPNNVISNNLIIEHLLRMLIQCGFMIIAMIIQYYQYNGDVLGYFKYSIIFFWCTLFVNLILTVIVKLRMKGFKNKIIYRMNLEDKKDDDNEYYMNDDRLFTRISNHTTYESNTDFVKIVPLKDSDDDQYLCSDNSDHSDDSLELQLILNEDLSNGTINDPICNSDSEQP